MGYRDDPDGVTVRDGQLRLDTTFAIFTPMVTTANGWDYVAAPQRDPRVACMLLAAAVWKQNPVICLATLESKVENAVRDLVNGAQEITIGDDAHRVWRTDIVIGIPLRSLLRKPYRPGRRRGP
jgi:hypothetical protein